MLNAGMSFGFLILRLGFLPDLMIVFHVKIWSFLQGALWDWIELLLDCGIFFLGKRKLGLWFDSRRFSHVVFVELLPFFFLRWNFIVRCIGDDNECPILSMITANYLVLAFTLIQVAFQCLSVLFFLPWLFRCTFIRLMC